MQKSFKKGFTLIELLVVIAIIGILSSVVLVSLNGARGKANAAKATADLSQVMTAIEMAASDACTAMTVTAGNPLTCTTPSGLPTYLGKVPGSFGSLTYTYNGGTSFNPSTGSYTLTVTGFTDGGTFTCAAGTCSCSDVTKCKN